MGQLTLQIKYKKNTGLIYSASELNSLFFFGTPLIDESGNKIPDETIEFYIDSARQQMEGYLNLKLNLQAYQENRDYRFDDWVKWSYLPTSFPVTKPIALKGFIGTVLQISYPDTWLSFKKQSPDDYPYHRNISLVPITGAPNSIQGTSNVLIGITPYVGFWGNNMVPNYWTATYLTGFNKIPSDILETIGKLASVSLFTILGDILLGAGIASKSQGIDGLSQSINTTASAMYSAFSARIGQYEKDLEKRLYPLLKGKYLGILFTMA